MTHPKHKTKISYLNGSTDTSMDVPPKIEDLIYSEIRREMFAKIQLQTTEFTAKDILQLLLDENKKTSLPEVQKLLRTLALRKYLIDRAVHDPHRRGMLWKAYRLAER